MIHLCGIDPKSEGFTDIVERYANPQTRNLVKAALEQ
jgi:hypothetical protein